tara:strand:+ start:1345 stop:1551 length:207 start_codon:yes stop_codon:yes gene_type:complete
MEMLTHIIVIFCTASLAFLSWIAVTVVDLKTDTAVISAKVAANHQMLTPLWQDFLRTHSNDNLAWFDK